MSVASRHPVRFQLRKQVFPEEGYFFRGGAKRTDIADFPPGGKKPTPFKFPVPEETADAVTRSIYKRGSMRTGGRGFVGNEARLHLVFGR
jgi:hypothetical protein